MYTALIIDDELNDRKYLFNLIQAHFASTIHVIDLVPSVTESVQIIQNFKPDFVFLDIEMPGENGFDLYKHLGDPPLCDVVITTAHKEYALAALKNGAFDYLLRPIDKIDLMSVLNKYKKKCCKQGELTMTQNYELNLPKLAVPTVYGMKFLELYSIVYACAEGSYTEIHTTDGKSITTTKSLKQIEELNREHHFFRYHKTYLVNLAYVTAMIKKDECFIVMINNQRIPLSTRKREAFQKQFM